MSGALAQVQRLLTLVPLLHERGELHVEHAAQVLGVTPRQVLRDLNVLIMVGTPGGYPGDLVEIDFDAVEEGVIRVSNADYLSRPMRLTPTEATALIVALRATRDTVSDDTAAVVDRTLAKLEAATAATGMTEPPVAVAADAESDDAAATRRLLEQAVAEERQVEVLYYVPARDEESRRVVDPVAVVSAHGHRYLQAWCHLAEAPRLFRLDRVHSAELLDSRIESARPTPHPQPRGEGLFAPSPDATRVTLILAPEARWVTEYYPVESVREHRDGLEVDLLVTDERWVRRLVLRLAPHARVLEPAQLADDIAALTHATRALYR
ncbi:helix-turn-helix transcriptional regulator [Nocardioides limicola]|uniref:helix-turn-helix transcriptional regulator n=1 Tax=Nocardioides limicola TaxID=2803368 RepID=UPI00193BB745|nr:WYL domain-containing protein [Nocardioides sp. DJM-14]